jgi:NDP-sugar pyrophosphorylase family protein
MSSRFTPQIIIPMSGFGERFRRVGYQVPKPLIEVEGKPIIAHVVDMFAGENDFVFICNQDHLDNPQYRMQEILNEICPDGRVVGIAPHKLGPVHAVLQVADMVDDARPTFVNYCDFTCYWDYPALKEMLAETECNGAVPAYRGFHPHSLGTTNYAYMREENMRLLDIKEKEPFTDNRMQEFASSGTYYFKSGAVMKQAFADCVSEGWVLNGEYYVSLAYKPMLAKGADIRVFELPYFMQWGTPEDVAEYNGWSQAFRQMMTPTAKADGAGHAVIIPMAGLGQRFADEGYTQTKPLIPVKGAPMVLAAVADLPAAAHYVFVMRADMPGLEEIKEIVLSRYPGAIIEVLPEVTQGQAITCQIGLAALKKAQPDFAGAVTFGACDNGALYDRQAFSQWLANGDSAVLVWGARGHANAVRRPEMFGWIDAEDELVRAVSVKQPLADPAHDPIITGTVSFRSGDDFERCMARLIERDGRVNGEFYLDSCINDALALDMECTLFDIDHYVSWGTPNDLRTFEYWQACFSKWASHPFQGF